MGLDPDCSKSSSIFDSPYPDVQKEGFFFIYRMRLFVSALLPFFGQFTGSCLSVVAYTFSQREYIMLSLIIWRSSLCLAECQHGDAENSERNKLW